MSEHEHQFAEEATPDGARILFPCLLCGMAAADALLQAQAERDQALEALAAPPRPPAPPTGYWFCTACYRVVRNIGSDAQARLIHGEMQCGPVVWRPDAPPTPEVPDTEDGHANELVSALIASHALLNKRSIEWLGSAPMKKTPEYLAWMEERRAVLIQIGEALRLATENPPCAHCGGPHPFDTSLPSPTWNAVIRAANLPDYLCLPCIVKTFVAAGQSFTATLWGDGLDGDEIEVTVNSAYSQDVERLSDENNELRVKLRAARPDAPEAPGT